MRGKEGFKRKSVPRAPLAPMVERFLPKSDAKNDTEVDILDIGSGPLSWVGTERLDCTIKLTAVDPLADEDNAELDLKGVQDALRPIKGYFENALWQLGPNQYDIVWCANSLDHSIDPVIGLYNIINLCKVGGGVILMFHPNEAEQENYVDLHQWNLSADNGRLTLTRKSKVFDMMRMIKDQGDAEILRLNSDGPDKPRVVVFFRKLRDCNLADLLVE